MKRVLCVCWILAILTVEVSGSGRDERKEVTKVPYKIGLMCPMTGASAQNGPTEIAACEVAIAQINDEGGLLGRPVTLVWADNGTDAEVSTRNTRRLILQEEVDVVLNGNPGVASYACSNICEQYEVLHFSNACQGDVYTIQATRWHFLPAASASMCAAAFAREMATVGEATVVTVAVDYSWGHDNVQGFKANAEKLGLPLEFIGDIAIPLNETTYTGYVTAIMAKKPDYVCTWLFGNILLNFMITAKDYGMLDKTTLTAWCDGQSFIECGKHFPEGVRVQSNQEWWALDIPEFAGPGWKEFRDAYQAKLNVPPTILAIEDYDALTCLFEAIKRCKSFDKEKIAATLEGGKFQTLRGELYFRTIDHQMNAPSFFGTSQFDPDLGFCTAVNVSKVPGEQNWYTEEEVMAKRAEIGYEFTPWNK